MVQRTSGGIKYDTSVRSGNSDSSNSSSSSGFPTKTEKKTGTEKLAEFREGVGDTRPTETPAQYRERITEPTPAPTQPTTPVTRITPAVPTPYIPSPVKDVESWQAAQMQPEPKPVTPVALPVPLKAIQERFEEPKQVTQEDIAAKTEAKLAEAQEAGYEATRNYEMSKFSRDFYERSTDIAETVREAAPITQATYAGVPVLKEVTPYVSESVARLVEFGGVVPGGLETLAKRPEVIKPAVTTAVIGVPKGIATQVVEEPAQLISDIAVGTLLGMGVTKAVKPVTAKIPAVELKTTIQEPLVKVSIPEAEVPAPIKPTMVKEATQLEFGGAKFHSVKDVKLSDISTEQISTALTTEIKGADVSTMTSGIFESPKKTSMPAYVGETKSGMTELFFKVDEPTLQAIGKEYFGEVSQFKTPEGKNYLAFEPTAPRPIEPITTPPKFKQFPETPDYIAIGETPGVKPYIKDIPGIRVVKKKEITPVDVEFGKVVTKEADIVDVSPIEQLQIKAGRQPIAKIGEFETFETDVIQIGKRYDITKQQEQFQAFVESTEAQVSPQVRAKRKAAQQQLITIPKEEVKPKMTDWDELIAQFEKEKAAYLKEEAEIFKPATLTKVETAQLQRPVTQNIFRSDIKAIFARQAPQVATPTVKTITGIKQKPIQKPVTKPFPVTVVKPAISFKPYTNQTFEQPPEQIPVIDFARYPIRSPIQKVEFKPIIDTTTKTTPVTELKTTTKTPVIPSIRIKYPLEDKKKKKDKIDKPRKIKGFEEFIENPIASPFRAFGKLGK